MSESTAIFPPDLEALSRLAGVCHARARASGFADEGDALRRAILDFSTPATAALHEVNLRNYHGNRLALIMREVTEAHEELRAHHPVTEVYYSDAAVPGGPMKPEGFLVELADTLIRVLDTAAEITEGTDLDFGAIVGEKLAFNASRGFKHGGKAF